MDKKSVWTCPSCRTKNLLHWIHCEECGCKRSLTDEARTLDTDRHPIVEDDRRDG